MLADEDIAALTRAESIALIGRIVALRLRPVTASDHRAQRRRLAIVTVCSMACLGLCFWVAGLAFSLPDEYSARNWDLAWVGFDVMMILALAAAAYLGWRRRLSSIVALSWAASMLVVDAWFDVVTADSGDRPISILTAALAEIPFALLLVGVAVMLSLRLNRMVNLLTGRERIDTMLGVHAPKEDMASS